MEDDLGDIRLVESPARFVMNISAVDWQEAMAEAMAPRPGDNEGKTTGELVEICGIPEQRVKDNLRQMMLAGRLESGRKRILAIDGIWRSVPAYKLKDIRKGA